MLKRSKGPTAGDGRPREKRSAAEGRTPRDISPTEFHDKERRSEVAERFLQKLRPGGPWLLTAIVPDGATDTITAHRAEEVAAFIREHDGKRNLYYSVNPTRAALNKKAAKTDIAAVEFALADLDPDEAESSDAAKQRYLAQLNGSSFQPRPVAAIDSGNGLQCLWRLADRIVLGKPVKVKVKVKGKDGKDKFVLKSKFLPADQAAIDDIEERVKAIMSRLGAKPGTQNIDRILRLPGTTNLPNRVKRELGRIPCDTKLLWFEDGACPLDAFPKPEEKTSSDGESSDDDSDQLSAEDFKELLEHGTLKGKKVADRSVMFHRVVWHLAASGLTAKGIVEWLHRFPKGIAAKFIRPRNRLADEVKRSFEKFKNHVPAIIAKWNQTYAHVLAGGKSAVLQEFTTAEGYIDFKLLSSGSFHEWNAEHTMVVSIDNKGKAHAIQISDYWLSHPRRRKYQDIGFFPGREAPKGYYNLWRGFAVEPRQGDCSKFLAHLRDNICQGDDELYDWVIAWFADIFQHPGNKCGTSLAVRGKQGTGKTKIGEVFASLLGVHFKQVSEPRYVTGQFNSHMISLLMLHADEGFWAGDKRAEGKLKDLVTGKTHPIEFKGKEAFWINNYVRLFVTGNPDWVVPAGFEERRFATLDAGDEHQQDYAYFAAIDAEMKAGGREALLYHLLFEVDCSKVNLRHIPYTTALLEQKLESASTEQTWWLNVLRNGALPGDTEGKGRAPSAVLFDDYIEHARAKGVQRRVIETSLGMFLQKTVPNLRRNKRNYDVFDGYGLRFSKRGLVYSFPPLAECRAHFAALLSQDVEWDEEVRWSKWS